MDTIIVRRTMPKFSELNERTHPFRIELYHRIYGELDHLADEAAERVYAGDPTYRAVRDDAVAVRTALVRLWNTVVEQERMETGQD